MAMKLKQISLTKSQHVSNGYTKNYKIYKLHC